MRRLLLFVLALGLSGLVSCQKQETEEEKNAEVERRVQERLATEHQTQQQQQLDQRQADLDSREKALAEKENASAAATSRAPENQSVEEGAAPSRRPITGERGMTTGYTTFYNRLEPYGDWIETGDYGYVFHPHEGESSQWRPYTDGRWVYTDAGWTWISEEPFGWATYHYGRWTRLRGIGWVWVPGNEWAPAWVSWRKSSDYVGWAPLPPEARFDQRTGIRNWADNYYDIGPDQYCFVTNREFGAPRIQQALVPTERNLTIVNQTTNITNITYNNTTIVNEGPSYDEIRTESREPVQRFRLQRNVNIDVTTAPPRSVVQGETVVIAAPVIAPPQPTERPLTVKQTIPRATVDLGWAAISNQEEAKKAREKMKSEATPPPDAPSKKFVKAANTTAPASEATATTSTSATIAPPAATQSAIATPVPAASTATSPPPASQMTPRKAPSAEQRSPRPPAISSPTPSVPPSPSISERHGRLLVPSSATPSASPRTRLSPSTSASPESMNSHAIGAKPGESVGGREAVLPGKSPEPHSTSSRSLAPKPTVSPVLPTAIPTASASALESLTKKEKKEEKRAGKNESKRERKEGAPAQRASPSATP